MEHQDHRVEAVVRAIGAQRLKAIREDTGLNQAGFAARLGVPVRTYRNYERGQRVLPQTVRIAVYRTFSVDPLPVDLADLPKPADVVSTSDETAKRDETLSFWGQLRAETKASLQSKSRTARFIQAVMDYTFAVSSGYGWLGCMLVGGEHPACTEPNIADSLFRLSCVLALLLIIPVTRDLPLIRIGRHLIGHSNPA